MQNGHCYELNLPSEHTGNETLLDTTWGLNAQLFMYKVEGWAFQIRKMQHVGEETYIVLYDRREDA